MKKIVTNFKLKKYKSNDSQGMRSLKNDANTGGSIVGDTRRNIEKQNWKTSCHI